MVTLAARTGTSPPVKPPPPVRVLLVEDEPKLAFAVRTLLELDDRAVVVGIAADGAKAVESALNHRPHVILLDVRLAGEDGVAAAAEIRQAWPKANIIVYSGDEDELQRAHDAGFTKTLLKGAIADQLLLLIKQTSA